jgi:ATP-dependent DNA ligase
MASARKPRTARGAVAADDLRGAFAAIDLPIAPPFPAMEAPSADTIPSGGGWLYEPKWDGFRCLAFKRDDLVLLQSKSGQPLGRYFPELVAAFAAIRPSRFVLDGEIVIVRGRHLDFDALLQRIHPAESRVQTLARQTPATFLAFDLLVDAHGDSLVARPLADRRQRLHAFFAGVDHPSIRLSPATVSREDAERWMAELGAAGLDGIVAKPVDLPYRSGERDGMTKVKRLRTADCIVAGFRYAQAGGQIGSLLLGLMNDEGEIDHVGFTSSFTADERKALKPVLLARRGGPGFTGRAPGGPSRWSANRSTAWEPLDGTLVCEVRFDHFSGDRFRHGTKFLRWRPDKLPRQCTFDQVRPARKTGILAGLGLT